LRRDLATSELLITLVSAYTIDPGMLINRTRAVILLGIRSFLSLIALVLLTTVTHEGAHYIAAVIMKVPITSFVWFDPRLLSHVRFYL